MLILGKLFQSAFPVQINVFKIELGFRMAINLATMQSLTPCGDGKPLQMLLREKQSTEIAGLDFSHRTPDHILGGIFSSPHMPF